MSKKSRQAFRRVLALAALACRRFDEAPALWASFFFFEK